MTLKRAFLAALVPVGIYLLVVAALYGWYEIDRMADQPGYGAVIGGTLSGLLCMPGLELLGPFGYAVDLGATSPDRFFAAALTAALLYALALVPLTWVAMSERSN